MASVLVFAVILFTADTVLSYGSGPPEYGITNPKAYTHCADLIPRHAGAVQNPTSSPVKFDATKLTTGRNIKVVLMPQGTFVGGFIVQGRNAAGNAIGSFVHKDLNHEHAKIISSCGGNTTVGHSGPQPKSEVTLYWSPPDAAGSVTFAGTFVHHSDHTQMWGVVKSDAISFAANPSPTSQSQGSGNGAAELYLTSTFMLMTALLGLRL